MIRQITIALVATVFLLCALPQAAAAQRLGVRAGVSAQPDQFYVGAHLLTEPIADRVRFRPSVEVGVGDNTVLTALNLEFLYSWQLPNGPWNLYAGGGPTANLYSHRGHRRGESETSGALLAVLGLEHPSGWFTEVKVGLIDSPSVKFGVGWTF